MKPTKKLKNRILKVLLIVVGIIILFVTAEVILAKVYLSKIETLVREEAKARINGDVELGEFKINIFSHFPNVSLSVRNVKIQDTNFDISKQPLLKAASINIQVKFLKLIQNQIVLKKITIIKGNVNMQRMPNGQWNTYNLVRAKEDPGTAVQVDNIELQQMHIISKDTVLANNNFDFIVTKSIIELTQDADGVQIVTNDRIYSHAITFRRDRGPCFRETKLHTTIKANWIKSSSTLTFEPSTIYIGKNKAYFEGTVKTKDSTQVNIVFTSQKVSMQTAVAMLSDYTREKLKPFNFTETMPIILKLSGVVVPRRPVDIDLYFKTSKNTFTANEQTFTEVALDGHYMNHLDENLLNEESNSGLFITDFKGKYEGIPLGMQMQVYNMITPYLNMKLSCLTDLTKFNNAVDTTAINFKKGKMELKINYIGNVTPIKGSVVSDSGAVINGYAKLIDAAYNIPNRKYQFSNITGTVFFNKHDIYFSEIPITINKNQTRVSGTFNNVSKSLFSKKAKTTAEVVITANTFNLSNFSPPTKRTSAPKPKNKIDDLFENLLTNIDVDIILNSGKIVYKQLALHQAKAQLLMEDNIIYCKKASFNTAGGSVNFFGSVTDIGETNSKFNLTADIQNADISNLFLQMNNFNQTAVTSKNIEGKLTAKINFAGSMSKSVLRQSSLVGDFNLNIKNGKLRNMTALNKISTNIFKNKEFSDIEFAELQHQSRLQGYDLYVDQMEIQSNVLTMFVNGIYSMKDNTELFIKIPISSLKQQDADYIAENNTPDEKIGLSINLKATKVAGDLKVMPILFQRNSKK